MGFFKLERHENGILIVFIDNPDNRVNMLSEQMLSELGDLLAEVEVDHFAKALVFISSKEDNFIVGADIREFDRMFESNQTGEVIGRLHALFNRISNLPFPAVAAINGPCLGGGLEFALACHFRIATDSDKTVLGLPEVKLGLLPAGGGTQRLTRLIGVTRALPLMLTGRGIDANRAKALGIVDLVVFPHDLLNVVKRSVPFLRKKFPRRLSYPRFPTLDWLLRTVPPARKLYFKIVRRKVANQTGGHYPAPFSLIDCVEAGIAGTISDGFKAEAEKFGPLILSPQSGALRKIFFLQTALKKRQFGSGAKPAFTIGILGSGLMGSGIAIVSARHGYRVVLKDVTHENLTRGLQGIWKYFDQRVRSRKRNPVERDKMFSLIAPALDYRYLARADLVVEAVFEDLALKQQVLKETEEYISPECIFASNTSAIPISSIASASKRPENVIGMHYFSPVPKMPLLEIVVHDRCADWVLATAVAVGRRQGKTVIVVKDGPGFYTTRILIPFILEGMRLIGEGASVEGIDQAIRRFGFPVGPVRLLDEVGIDVAVHIAHELEGFFGPRGFEVPTVLDEILENGFAGKKSGMGFYDYTPSITHRLHLPGFEPHRPVNPKIYRLLGGTPKKPVESPDPASRPVFLMINEAALCLQEGVISSPEDGDAGAVLGLGFPPFLGGPFRYLDFIGINKVVSEMETLASRLGPRFEPAPILVEMAGKAEKFYKDTI
jgi:3-hydroxyacyl-CoA dehydrogenase / enoyl-CoA hydratase / 3-hydroxybutyryl-CoA epimerase